MGWMEYLPSIGWLAALILFAVIEGMTVGLVSIWFALGAAGGLIASAITENIWVQIIVFLVVSLAALLVIRPLAARSAKGKQEATNADRVIGQEGVVTEEIEDLRAKGQVKVGGSVWTARTEGEGTIPEGTVVKVLRIEGVKLIVAPAAVANASKG